MLKINKISFFHNGHLSNEGISLYADGMALKGIDLLPAQIRDHVEECESCRTEVFATYEVIKNQDYIGDISTHPFFSKKSKSVKTKSVSLKFWIPAAAFILILFGILLLMNRKTDKATSNIVSSDAEVSKVKNNELPKKENNIINDSNSVNKDIMSEPKLMALSDDKFKPDDIFESIIESEHRGDQLEVYSPTENVQYSKDKFIEFKWNTLENSSLNLIVYDNKSIKIFEKNQINSNSYKINSKFEPGLYYFKIIQNDELLKAGKFIVK